MEHPWSKVLNLTITILFGLLIFFVPIVFWPTSELFEFNKMMLTYALTGLILALWLAQGLVNKKLEIRRTPLDLPLLLFLLGQIITTILSIDPHTSIWGYYSRFHGGLASTFSYLILYFVFTSHFSQPESKNKLKFIFYTLISSTTLVAIYGILEHFGIDKNLWIQDVQNRVFSTLGQPNWLSAYLLAVLPLPLFLALNSKKKKSLVLWGAISTVLLLTIYFTKSRSGLGATAAILFIITIIKLKQKLNLPYLSLLVLLPVIFYFGQDFLLLISPFGTSDLNQVVAEDLAERGNGGSNSMVIRQVVWQGARDLFKYHPLTGTGPETFGYAYYQVRPAAHNLLSEWDFLYNKAHNEYLNFLATTGLIGTLTYLYLILATIHFLSRPQGQSKQTELNLAILIGYISILITNYFGFSVVPVALLFYLYPAVVVLSLPKPRFINIGSGWSLTKKEVKTLKKSASLPSFSLSQYLGLTLLLLLLSIWLYLLTTRWVADTKYTKGKAYASAGYLSQALPLLESAVKLYPAEPTFRSILAETYAGASLATKEQLDSLPASQAASLEESAIISQNRYRDLAIDSINLTLDQNPWHLNFRKSEAKIYLTLAQIDPNYYYLALNSLLKANELAPTDSKIIYNIGLLHLTLGDQNQAETAFRQAVSLRPNYDAALIELIKLLKGTNNDDAGGYLDQLLKYYPDHPAQTELRDKI